MRRALADVLWDAANVWLSHTQDHWLEPIGSTTHYLTCNATAKAIKRGGWWHSLPATVKAFFLSLGCPLSSPDGFNYFPQGEERQGVRYMWLLLAMHVAEDEGITV